MDKPEASLLLQKEIEARRAASYAELAELLDEPATIERRGESGVTYQLEVQVLWDDRPGGNLRVLVSIDDGGWRSLVPVSDDFIVAPDGSFVGE